MLTTIIRAFIDSKLTPLLVLTAFLLGVFAVGQLSREEEPQIVVPMMDVFVEMPGVSSKEVEERITIPLEKLIASIPGVEHVYSTSTPGRSMVTVIFYLSDDEPAATVKLYNKLYAHLDALPPGASQPLVKSRSIDDVPIVTLTLWSAAVEHVELRRLARQLEHELRDIPDVAETLVIGGPRRVLNISLLADRLAARHVDPTGVVSALQGANRELTVGAMAHDNTEYRVTVGGFLRDSTEVGQLVVGAHDGRPVYLREVATVADGPEEPDDYVLFATGPAASSDEQLLRGQFAPAVMIALAKRRGTNAVAVAERILSKVTALSPILIPADVHLIVSRNYGETAQDKFTELLEHLVIAIVSVTLLIALFLGGRAAAVVFIAIPATLALTLFFYYCYGYTLNRVSFFGLILSIGILVDDPIVNVENIVRHLHLPENRRRPLLEVMLGAVTEVGSPLILATLAVIFAVIPLAWVGGLTGAYTRPMSVGAAVAMAFSMLIAFVVTPWAAYWLFRRDTHAGATAHREGWSIALYRRGMGTLLRQPWYRWLFLGMIVLLLIGAIALLLSRAVLFKLLPFDDKSEFKVIINMPEGTALEETARVTTAVGDYLGTVPEVMNFRLCIGTASPFDFNGLVRRYFLRRGANVADIDVNLLPKREREQQGHTIVKRLRPDIQRIAAQYGAQVTLAEPPPGPPVQQTLVAEVYGPDMGQQIATAAKVHSLFHQTAGISDIDWSVEAPQPTYTFAVDKVKASLHGIATERIVQTIQIALGGISPGLFHLPLEKEEVPFRVHLPRAQRSRVADVMNLKILNAQGTLVPLAELAQVQEHAEPPFLYRKDLKRVVYVTGDTVGREESPIYPVIDLTDSLRSLVDDVYFIRPPFLTEQVAVKWDGEWQVTYEFLHDVGLAFLVVLILIYTLVVAWFQSFVTPLVILSPIPLSLIGILPAHWLLGASFSGTSVIGFIAGAGVVVRNSIILVDFIELRQRQGMPLVEAVVDAGAVRFRPMLLTASAVVVGTAVILHDPIFQGLAISMMAGEVASTFLSRLAVPVLYYMSKRRNEEPVIAVAPFAGTSEERIKMMH